MADTLDKGNAPTEERDKEQEKIDHGLAAAALEQEVEGKEEDKYDDKPKHQRPRKKQSNGDKPDSEAESKVEQQARDAAQAEQGEVEKSREEEVAEAREALEALDPTSEPIRWVIGKPPEHGGTTKQFSVYVQDTMPWMPRQRFFALVGATMSKAIRASGGEVANMADVFGGDGGGSLIERGRRLTQRDFADATSFMALAFELVAYSPDFLLDCYCIWLDVQRDERGWAKLRFNERWDPENDQWGLKDDDHEKLCQAFIDQNYEDIRRFFVVTLPALGKRVALHEKSKDRDASKDHE